MSGEVRVLYEIPAGSVIRVIGEPDLRTVRLEPAWECLYPEFADEMCLYDHDPAATLMPRKHDGCGWNLLREVQGE